MTHYEPLQDAEGSTVGILFGPQLLALMGAAGAMANRRMKNSI